MEEKTTGMGRESNVSRRFFMGAVALAGAVWASCRSPVRGEKIQPGPETAPDGPLLKAGLVGCGGRGTGASLNFLESAPHVQIAALADVFQDRLDRCRQKLGEKAGVKVPDDRCFVGFDAFQKLIDSGVDIVLLATPPHFRPQHFSAAVEARKHVFMEKPLAVDPPGVRSILQTAQKADAFNLRIATGTQFRHQKSFIETYNRIQDGAIGDIVAARCYSLRGQLWYKTPREDWSEMEAMIRDWVNWQWLSGDHIVEQHIHGLDVIQWFTGSRPEKAIASGGRMRRVTGDQYDFFNVDFELQSGIHVHSMCRQIDGCTNNISRWVVGTRGFTNCRDTLYAPDGTVKWKYESEEDKSPYVQEHTDLVTAIRTDTPANEAARTAHSTLKAIMARMSAYSGLEVTWDEAMQSELRLGPKEYAMGPVEIETQVPVPGSATKT
ncbi:MAG: Gfo/Idh/MocA family protein [Acidobacteriota bacterium]